MSKYCVDFQERRSKISEEVVDQFMTPRPLTFRGQPSDKVLPIVGGPKATQAKADESDPTSKHQQKKLEKLRQIEAKKAQKAKDKAEKADKADKADKAKGGPASEPAAPRPSSSTPAPSEPAGIPVAEVVESLTQKGA